MTYTVATALTKVKPYFSFHRKKIEKMRRNEKLRRIVIGDNKRMQRKQYFSLFPFLSPNPKPIK